MSEYLYAEVILIVYYCENDSNIVKYSLIVKSIINMSLPIVRMYLVLLFKEYTKKYLNLDN